MDRWLRGEPPGPVALDQMAEWEAFYALEPWGGLRDDARAGRVAAAIVNNIPFRGRGARPLKPDDLFATLRPPQPPQTANQLRASALGVVAAFGGRVITADQLRREQAERAARRTTAAEAPAAKGG